MGNNGISDAPHWDQCLSGDSRAFGVIFDRHRDRVFHHARRFVEQSADAEDVTAIAFLELWRRRQNVRIVDNSVLPWLLVTTGYAARNVVRSRRRYRRFLETLPAPEPVPDVGDDVVERIDNLSQARAISEAVRGLSSVDQDLIMLTTIEGLTLRQAGAALNLSYGTAKTRLSRARHRLGDALANPATAHFDEGLTS